MANQFQKTLTYLNPFSKSEEKKRDFNSFPAKVQFQRIRQDMLSAREAVTEAELAFYPHRVKQQRLYIDTILNGHVTACWSKRKALTLLRKWEFVDNKGNIDQKTTDIFLNTVKGQSQNKAWFNKFLSHGMDAIPFGYTLVSLGDVINDEFPELDIVRRWNVSPDRLNITKFVYSLSGLQFMDDPDVKDWIVWIPTTNEIGTSKCGYGLLYKVAIYEIFLRNLLGFNGDFVELFAQPYRVGKSTATGTDRDNLESALQNMGSSGYAIIDPNDEIEFLETALGGTGYKGYDNFEQRLEKKISKIILGHADAIDSVPGKLGNNNEKSPAQIAMEEKQTEDGSFIAEIINGQLFEKMRALGFDIPIETVAVLKNDSEIMEINNAVIQQAVEMQKAGLKMKAEFFTEQTGIPVEEVIAPVPVVKTPLPTSIKNKLDKLYNHNHKH
jgi:phage gp29-like protein